MIISIFIRALKGKMMRILTLIAFCTIVPLTVKAEVAYLQIANPKGWMQVIYFLDTKSEGICKGLIDNYWRGLQTRCPECVKEFSGCLDTLPKSYSNIIPGRAIVFPYIASQKLRIIYAGMPLAEAIQICRQTARNFREHINRPATCVLPR